MPVLTVNSRNTDGTPILKEGEQVLATQPNVSLYFNPAAPEGNGTAYVTTMNVIWLSQDDTTKGYSIDFPFISLHAVSRDTTYFPHQCLYCQLDVEVPEEDDDDDEENGESMSDSTPNNHANGTSTYSEARFVPADPQVLSTLFDAFSQGASLNPDEELEDEGDFFYNEDEVNRNLAALEGAIQLPGDNEDQSDQFADADNDDQEMSG